MNGRDEGGARGRKDAGHVRLYWTMLDSHAWRALAPTDIVVFLAMRRQLNGSNNGLIDATASTMREWGVTSPTTLAKSLRVLAALGFIENLRPGRLTHGGKVCALYRFTDQPCQPSKKRDAMQAGGKATNEWKAWRTLADAEKAADRARAPAFSQKDTSKLHFLESSATDSGVVRSRKWSMAPRQDPDSGGCRLGVDAAKSLSRNQFQPTKALEAKPAEAVGKLQNLDTCYMLPGPRAAARGARLAGVISVRLPAADRVSFLRAARPTHLADSFMRAALSRRMGVDAPERAP